MTRNIIYKALDDVRELKGNIVKLARTINNYRYKIYHYRIIIRLDKNVEIVITVIDTRINIKYRKY